MSRAATGIVALVVIYLATMASVAGLLWRARTWATAELSRASSVDEWQKWKADVLENNAAPDAPVKRRMPKSDEPPALVLLRDGFAGVLGATLVVASFIYAVAAFFTWGIFFSRATVPSGSKSAPHRSSSA